MKQHHPNLSSLDSAEDGHFRMTRRVYLYDTDASGLLFIGAPTRWFTEAETQLLAGLGVDILTDEHVTPVRSLSIEFLEPLGLHDEVVQKAWIDSVGNTSFTITHHILHDRQLAIRAVTRHVYVRRENSKIRPTRVPDSIRQAAVNTRLDHDPDRDHVNHGEGHAQQAGS